MSKKHFPGGPYLLSLLLLLSACGGNEPGQASVDKSETTPLFNIGGTVSGLGAGQTLTLLNKGADPVSLDESATEFVFPTALASGSTYEVSVEAQPAQQTCFVSHGLGTIQDDHVKDIQVTCAVNTFTIGGAVTGLGAGEQLTLLNNGIDPLTVQANGAFTFSSAVASGGSYNVTVQEHPSAKVCSVINPEGNNIAENMSALSVVCESGPPPAAGLHLAWQDEFNHLVINEKVWSVANSARDNAWRSPKSVNLVDGYLDLRVFNKPASSTYYSGFIQTQKKFEFKYGYIEAKVRFKSQPGQWSAFWLMSNGNVLRTPEDPSLGTEIDIIEHRSIDSTLKNIENSFQSNVHWNGYGALHRSYGSGQRSLPAGQKFTDWKVLGLRWTPNAYIFYLDNKEYFRSSRAVSQSNQFIMLTNEIRNGSWAGNMPAGGYGAFGSDSNAWMQVDWVRLWQD